jgi:hypothetical protein
MVAPHDVRSNHYQETPCNLAYPTNVSSHHLANITKFKNTIDWWESRKTCCTSHSVFFLTDMCMVGGSEISSRALHTGAMAVCMQPPMIERGDWLKTFGRPTSVRLKFYTDAPPHGRAIPLPIPLGQNYYIGPVHGVARCGEFLTVVVPHPVTGQLVFCNIWTCYPRSQKHWQPIRFCEIVKSSQDDCGVKGWEGWEKFFQEMTYEHWEFMPIQ